MPFQSNAAYNRERVAEAIGLHWGVHWPGRQIETARGVRRVPLHAKLEAAGAMFAERVGWEVPMYFDPGAEGWPSRASLGFQDWWPRVEAEVNAVQYGAGLLDQSMYAKILVQGPDAAHALNRVSGAQMDVPVGTSVYAQFLNSRGGIEADVTATRLEAEQIPRPDRPSVPDPRCELDPRPRRSGMAVRGRGCDLGLQSALPPRTTVPRSHDPPLGR